MFANPTVKKQRLTIDVTCFNITIPLILHHLQMFPVDSYTNMHTHPERGRRRPTAARRPSAASGAWANPAGRNQSSCFPPEKERLSEELQRVARRRASEAGPKSALLTSSPSPPIDSLIRQSVQGRICQSISNISDL